MNLDKPSVPFVVKYPWYMKLLVLPLIPILVIAFLPNPTPIAFELWEQQNLVFQLCMLLCAVMIPAGIAEVFFFRMVFTESGIERRNKFLRKDFRPYSEIDVVEYRPDSSFQPASLIITFLDARTIRLYSGLANLETVGKIIDTYSNRPVFKV